MGNTITVKTKRPTIRDLRPGQCFRLECGPGEGQQNPDIPLSSTHLLMRIADRVIDGHRFDPGESRAVRLLDGDTFSWPDDTEVAAVFDLDIKAVER